MMRGCFTEMQGPVITPRANKGDPGKEQVTSRDSVSLLPTPLAKSLLSQRNGLYSQVRKARKTRTRMPFLPYSHVPCFSTKHRVSHHEYLQE